jgi:hypothetical protein
MVATALMRLMMWLVLAGKRERALAQVGQALPKQEAAF